MVFARSHHAAKAIQPQFKRGLAGKTYLCRVAGHPAWNDTTSRQPIARTPSNNGCRVVDRDAGDAAETAFRVLARLETGESLVEAAARTGRTNQIRVHLWDLKHPIVGDPVYLADMKLGTRQTLSPADPPMCLHAWRLTFEYGPDRER